MSPGKSFFKSMRKIWVILSLLEMAHITLIDLNREGMMPILASVKRGHFFILIHKIKCVCMCDKSELLIIAWDDGTTGRRDNGTTGRRDDGTTGRRDDGTTGRRDEETHE